MLPNVLTLKGRCPTKAEEMTVNQRLCKNGHCIASISDTNFVLNLNVSIYISGNHEYVVMDVDNWFTHLKALGFTILHNSNVRIGDPLLEGEYFCLAGVDDWDATKLMP